MENLPDFHLHLEPPFLKHIQKFETDVFPTCNTVKVEWPLGRKFVNQKRHLLLIHHSPSCTYDITDIHDDGKQLHLDKLGE